MVSEKKHICMQLRIFKNIDGPKTQNWRSSWQEAPISILQYIKKRSFCYIKHRSLVTYLTTLMKSIVIFSAQLTFKKSSENCLRRRENLELLQERKFSKSIPDFYKIGNNNNHHKNNFLAIMITIQQNHQFTAFRGGERNHLWLQ